MADTTALEGHTSRAYDGELGGLQLAVVSLGGLVLSQARAALAAYIAWDPERARHVTEREPAVDALQREIEDEAMRVIARRQPVARDLKAVLVLNRVAGSLERAGDEADRIARAILGEAMLPRTGGGFRSATRDSRQIGGLALALMRDAVEAFDRLDPVLASRVVQRDQEVDAEYTNAMRRALSRALEDPRRLQDVVEVAFVLRSIERIGDHARNVALQVLALSPSAAVR